MTVEDERLLREAYRDRAHLAAVLAALPDVTARLTRDPGGEPGRTTVLYLHTQRGQVTFHLDDVDVELVQHVLWAAEDDSLVAFDGHTKDDAQLRLRELVQVLVFPPGEPSPRSPWDVAGDPFTEPF